MLIAGYDISSSIVSSFIEHGCHAAIQIDPDQETINLRLSAAKRNRAISHPAFTTNPACGISVDGCHLSVAMYCFKSGGPSPYPTNKILWRIFMKKNLQILMIAIALLTTFGETASASLIGTFSDRAWYGDLAHNLTDHVQFEASYYLRNNIDEGAFDIPPPNEWPGWVPMIDLTLDASHEGSTWVYNSASQGYTENVQVLTNGMDDVFAKIRGGSGWGYTSEAFYWDYYAGKNGIDLEGYTIESICFTLDAFKPIDDAGAIYYSVDIYGEPVPLPGAFLLLSSGIAGLAGFRRLRRN